MATRPCAPPGGAVARPSSIIVYMSSDSDVHASRLVCDIIIVDVQGTATSLAETILWAGLAHPMPGAPATYLSAYTEAESAAAGVFSVFTPALAKSLEVLPRQAKSSLHNLFPRTALWWRGRQRRLLCQPHGGVGELPARCRPGPILARPLSPPSQQPLHQGKHHPLWLWH